MINSKSTAEHYKWGEDCDGWHLLQSPDLSVIQEQMPSGTAEALHYHEKAKQVFYILAGEATFVLGESTYILITGDSINVAPGMAHQISNKSNKALHFLVISAPKSHGDKILISL